MSSRIPRAGSWHEGIGSEELHEEMANSLADQLSNKHRRAVVAFVLCFAAIFVLGIAAVTMVRVAPTPETRRTSDADMSIDRANGLRPRPRM
jgi:hypothetical protein